jgi:glycosyltransferase involved in cell wall biosynthesis
VPKKEELMVKNKTNNIENSSSELIKKLKKEVEEEKIRLADIEAEYSKIEAEYIKSKKLYESVTKSYSWAISAPLRKLNSIKKKVVSPPAENEIPASSDIENPELLDLQLREAQKEVEGLRIRLIELGFAEKAYKELNQLANDENSKNPFTRQLAAWELVLWHADKSSKDNALKALELMPLCLWQDRAHLGHAAIIQAECHAILGDYVDGNKIIDQELGQKASPDLYLAKANLKKDSKSKVAAINEIMQFYNLSRVGLSKNQKSLYDGLYTENIPTQEKFSRKDHLVSVIVPVFNSEKTIKIALDSLINQTWQNLEILVVDDCSTDSTTQIVRDYSKNDTRIRLIKAKKNGGPYAARNIALSEARGEFVTCHDADDWSHAQKIEKQVNDLINNHELVANMSSHARINENLIFSRRGNRGFYLQANMSSLMFRRKEVLAKIGYWDSVRFAGDTEFVERLNEVFGKKAVGIIQAPLSFLRMSGDSLTGSSKYGWHGYAVGVRKEYSENRQHYYSLKKSLKYDFPMKKRPFTAPYPMLHKATSKKDSHFDVIIASDFRLHGGSNLSNLEEIKAQKKSGIKTGLMQMYRYDYDPWKKIDSRIRDQLDGKKVQMLVYGEEVTCDLLIVRYPAVLQETQVLLPQIKAKKICVIVNQTPLRDYGNPDSVVYQIPKCAANTKQYFGKDAEWWPIGPQVRDALETRHAKDLELIKLAKANWSNIINVSEWKRKNRPAKKDKTVIGRHSRDIYTKWPSDTQTILDIYPDSETYEVRILGGAKSPVRILGEKPKNWQVYELGSLEPKKFLAELDVFVYFTDKDYVESFGRSILEAMAVGVPVVLPFEYRKLFGDAAVYSEPKDVKIAIDRLMKNKATYDSQVKKAWDYVEKNFGYDQHTTRLKKYTETKS